MVRLKYYEKEKDEFRKYWSTELNDANFIRYVFKRLKSHYKFWQNLEFTNRYSNIGGGRCNQARVSLGYVTNVGILAHEVAHAIDFEKRPILGYPPSKVRRHSKKHLAIMRRVLNYIDSHIEEWRASFQSKTVKESEAFKIRQARDAEREAYKKTVDYKLEQLLVREKRLLTKQKRITTLLKKIQRRIKRLGVTGQ